MPDAIEMPARRARSEVARQMRLLAVELEKLTLGLCSIAVDCASFATNMRAVAESLEQLDEISPAATTRPSEGAAHSSPRITPPGPRPESSPCTPGGVNA